MACGAGGARLLDPGEVATAQQSREIAGVGRRRRRSDERRLRAELPADALEPLQHVMEMTAEDAPIGVELVEHQPAQVAEKRRPLRPPSEDSDMKHVGVRDQDAGGNALDPPSILLGSVAVENGGRAGHLGGGGETVDLLLLIATERLERVQEQRPAGTTGGRLLEHRKLEDERLTRGGRRRHEHVLTATRGVDRRCLVRPKGVDAGRG